MAEIVLGIGTSHSPVLALTPDLWPQYSSNDPNNRELISTRSATRVTYDELLKEADPSFADRINMDQFQQEHERLQRGIAEVRQSLQDAKPDVVIIISDDQDEILFDDNMPAFSIYWGETVKLLPRQVPPDATEMRKKIMAGYGDVELDVPVDSELGEHVIKSLIDQDFDISHSRYLRNEYGGNIGPSGYVWWKRETPPRPFGIGHGWGFVVKRLMDNKPFPILPVIINTCYPPNQPTPRRCYALGKAIRNAVKSWDSNKRVAIVASGGLSHFVVDEEIDRMVIQGMQEHDGELLGSIPRERLNSASSEIRNWITAAGALSDLDFELIEYVPAVRTPAGTGGGWAFARWT